MIYLGKKAATLDEAREMAEKHLVDGSAYRKFKEVVHGAGRQSAGAGQVRTAAERHRHARDHFAARRLRQRHQRRRYRRGVHHDRRGPRHARKTRSIRPSA